MEKIYICAYMINACGNLQIQIVDGDLGGSRQLVLQSEYKLHGHILETEEASSYLGVTITDNLTWDKHIQKISNKGNRNLGFIRRNLRDCTVPVKAATYTAMVRPSLEYASTVWDTPNQAHIKQLESVQRIAARYVYNDNHSRKTRMRHQDGGKPQLGTAHSQKKDKQAFKVVQNSTRLSRYTKREVSTQQ